MFDILFDDVVDQSINLDIYFNFPSCKLNITVEATLHVLKFIIVKNVTLIIAVHPLFFYNVIIYLVYALNSY